MKLQTILTGILLILVVISCSEREPEFDGKVKITGKLENAPEGQGHLVISQYLNDRMEVLDTIPVNNNGKFSYELELDGPNFYDLNLFHAKNVRLALYHEDADITYDFQDEESLKISGSKDTEHTLKIDELGMLYQEEIQELYTAYYDAMGAKDQEAIKEIQEREMHLGTQHADRVKNTIREMDGSFAAIAALVMLNPRNDFQFLDSILTALNTTYPDQRIILTMKQQLDELKSLSIGQPAPEISLPNPEGETVNLSDLRGNYVLIDFWAGWCKPCREENPNVVRLYNQYNEKGFEVFGVSLDRTREAWVNAIEEDGLRWTQVSDLQYFNSEAASIYKIDGIPATYLLDPDGNIIAKDLRGSVLENKLKELFD